MSFWTIAHTHQKIHQIAVLVKCMLQFDEVFFASKSIMNTKGMSLLASVFQGNINYCPQSSDSVLGFWTVIHVTLKDSCKFFIMSTEFHKNISDWSHYCTDHKNGNDFFMSLVKWPKVAVKKTKILGKKVVQFWCYTKLIKNKKVAPKLIFFNGIFLRKIRRIFDVENRL